MTYEERDGILSKEVLSIADMQRLTDLPYQSAAKLIRDIKRRSDRLGIRGKIATLDYLDYMGITTDRYGRQPKGDKKPAAQKSRGEERSPRPTASKEVPIIRLRDYKEGSHEQQQTYTKRKR